MKDNESIYGSGEDGVVTINKVDEFLEGPTLRRWMVERGKKMNYLPCDICEKLVEKGCKSESRFYYFNGEGNPLPDDYMAEGFVPYTYIPAFIFQDFCGISEQARANMYKLWPGSHFGYPACNNCGLNQNLWSEPFTCIYDIRAKMLDMTEDEWVEFMRRAVG